MTGDVPQATARGDVGQGEAMNRVQPRRAATAVEPATRFSYAPAFGNHFATEAVPGAQPIGRNSPQHVRYGLYAEQLSGTAFTAPRAENRRAWLYRLRPSAAHGPFDRFGGAPLLRSAPFDEIGPTPNRLRWDPLPLPTESIDFVDSLVTSAGNGGHDGGAGLAIHGYAKNCSMTRRLFFFPPTANC